MMKPEVGLISVGKKTKNIIILEKMKWTGFLSEISEQSV
jgi:hypothetical protein